MEKWIKEDNKNVLRCYLKSNPAQKWYRKRTIEIWAESARFNTNQKLANQARRILKKCWFSGFEILEICRHVNREKYEQEPPIRIYETINTEKQEPPTRTDTQNPENQNITDPQ